jgi:PAS domain-containing protein
MADGSFVVPADRLADPYLLVTPEGTILSANPAAAEEFGAAHGQGLQGQRLGERVGNAPDRLEAYLRLCATSAEPLPGSLTLKDGRAFRVDGFLLFRADAGNPPAVCLRLRVKEASNASFVALNDKIVELSHEIRIRLATEVRLRQTLAERDNLIRELHHRNRNTLQVVVAMPVEPHTSSSSMGIASRRSG